MTFADPYGAGLGPAGFAPLPTATQPVAITAPVALRFDGATGDWLMNSDGEYTIDHPADQGVALALCIKAGDIKSSPTTGNKIHLITDLGSKDLRGQVEDAVMNAVPLASFVADGSISVDKIAYEVRPHGGLVVRVHYRNLLLGRSGVATTP